MYSFMNTYVDIADASDNADLLGAEEMVFTFEPGKLGLGVHRNSGQVFMVERYGQGERLGVAVGMVMEKIDGFPYTSARLSRCLSGPCVFNISFRHESALCKEASDRLTQEAEQCFAKRRACRMQKDEDDGKLYACLASLRDEVEKGEGARLAVLEAEANARKEYKGTQEVEEPKRTTRSWLNNIGAIDSTANAASMLKTKSWYHSRPPAKQADATAAPLLLPATLHRESLSKEQQDASAAKDRRLCEKKISNRGRYAGA